MKRVALVTMLVLVGFTLAFAAQEQPKATAKGAPQQQQVGALDRVGLHAYRNIREIGTDGADQPAQVPACP